MSEYNYMHFPLDGDMDDFIRFPHVARVSSKAPDGTLIDAESGAEVHLGELYRKGVTVIEFGSYT
jgi:hypothetical protein